jgi:hypothetical protein
MQGSLQSAPGSRRFAAPELNPPKNKKVIITDTYFPRGVEMADYLREKYTPDVTLLVADRHNQAALDNLRREFQGCLNRALKHYDPTRQDITVIMNLFTSVNARIWELLQDAEEHSPPVRKLLVSCEGEEKFPFLPEQKSRVSHIPYHDDRNDYLELLDGQLIARP